MSKEIQKKEKDHFQIDWNEHASYWDEDKNAIIYNNRVMDTLNDVLNIQDLRIMDFGCGTGLLTDRMSKKAREIVAIDASKKMLEVLKAKKYKKVSAIHGKLSIETIEKNPVLHRKFDLIVAASVCAFLPNYIEVLQRIKSLLKPDGIFVQWDWMPSPADPDFGFTEAKIRENYKAVGLEVKSVDIGFFFQEYEEKMEVLMAIGKLAKQYP